MGSHVLCCTALDGLLRAIATIGFEAFEDETMLHFQTLLHFETMDPPGNEILNVVLDLARAK